MEGAEHGGWALPRATYLVIAVGSASGLFLDSDGGGILYAGVGTTEGVESDGGFEVVGDGDFGLGFWFWFGSEGGDGGGSVVVVMYSGVTGELV